MVVTYMHIHTYNYYDIHVTYKSLYLRALLQLVAECYFIMTGMVCGLNLLPII